MPEMRTTVFVVDDDDSLRRALERLLRAEGYTVEGFASAEAYLARAAHEGPGCLLLDLALPGIDGLALHARLARDAEALPVVFLSGHADIPASVRAMKLGAIDFLTKPADDKVLLAAVRAALARRAVQLDGHSRLAALSEREREVMNLIVQGLRNRQIAAQLGITERTVKAHRARVMEKTGAASLPELVRLVTGEIADPPPGTP
jgi:FixJ family two-component response regulator